MTAKSLWFGLAVIALSGCAADETAADEHVRYSEPTAPVIGYIHEVSLLETSTDTEASAPPNGQFALLYSEYDQCDLTGAYACPLRDGDVLFLSGVRVEYSLCNQYARTVEFSDSPVEYGFYGTCEEGVMETYLSMKQVLGIPLHVLPFKDLIN